ncbi:UvrD-helicase domain-containing protein [Bradyrhizobium sp. NBAIM08]|uniref:UvrD-helicase domain-containing protein n=1 Tax=Bradyrhizobium sp. NBAIM08 TaxID=2793815 RepID=UPI001CD7204C|nr:UvrD-helicase domain-containing protein [Bradyrhizobium sp. NBAIM08]MCA1478924.1 AAA family ATPase [Bradyrhizobium sp. NBAIM08]
MKTLPQVVATAEQLPLISQNRFGVEVICGAAGSGKTSTALLRLRSLCYMFAARRKRRGDAAPVRVLVLTYNRTLAGYVRSLAEHQISGDPAVELEIETFGRWAMSALGFPDVADDKARRKLRALARTLGVLTPDYILKETEYLLGRFEPEHLDRYLTAERTGRGNLPRVDRNLRRRILTEVVTPYIEWLEQSDSLDWNSVAIRMARDVDPIGYNVIIVDESQDFSANQLRAIRRHLADDHAITFVIDTVQRI